MYKRIHNTQNKLNPRSHDFDFTTYIPICINKYNMCTYKCGVIRQKQRTSSLYFCFNSLNMI